MKKLQFSTTINASPQEVWNKLWSDDSYRKWTAVFAEGSYAESDWQQGSEIRFLGPQGGGMYAIIETMIPNKEMNFKHMGEIKDGVVVEQPWAGAHERYLLNEKDGATELIVEMDTTEEMGNYFSEKFPAALAILRKISEQ